MKKPHLLVILDGFGYRKETDYNAITKENTSNFQKFLNTYPNCLLKASGNYVGLMDNMIGNSAVGHLTIGSGRIIKQPALIFHELIENKEIFQDKMLINYFKDAIIKNSTLHLIGLLSDAGVHSHEELLYALLSMAHSYGIKDIVIHPILDGRDVPPASATIYLNKLDNFLKNKIHNAQIGSLHGRFYAMDRDNNWDRIELSYKVLTKKQKILFKTWQQALDCSYEKNITDEFFVPIQIAPDCYVKKEDSVILFNFRADRSMQLARALFDKNIFPKLYVELNWLLTATKYSDNLKVEAIIKEPKVEDTLLDVLEKNNKKIFTIAETEKYAHITYFFNGGREIIRKNETRILIPSIKTDKTYANLPRMSAEGITKAVLDALKENRYDFVLINYANPDMVGHSGDFKATELAIKCIDEQLGILYQEVIEKQNGTLFITSDHGKAETMWDYDLQQPRTAHTNNPVYFIFIDNKSTLKKLNLNKLSDIAPFILKNMGLKVPYKMKK